MLVKQHAFPTAAYLLGKQALHPNWSCGIVYTDDKKIARTGRLRPRWDRTTPLAAGCILGLNLDYAGVSLCRFTSRIARALGFALPRSGCGGGLGGLVKRGCCIQAIGMRFSRYFLRTMAGDTSCLTPANASPVHPAKYVPLYIHTFFGQIRGAYHKFFCRNFSMLFSARRMLSRIEHSRTFSKRAIRP